jgi:hypothetical protein
MQDYLSSFSDKALFIILSIFFTVVSIIVVLIVQRYIPNKLRRKQNGVVGVISSLIGLIYGVLAGLTALYLINNLSYTGDAVQREANSVANLYRDSTWLKEPQRDDVKKQIVGYLNAVINVEWPLMKNGDKVTDEAEINLESIADLLHTYATTPNTEMLILHDMLDDVKSLYNARETRIQMSYEFLNTDLWVVILIGTFLLMAINFLFGMNLYFHMITSTATALMASSMIFLLLTLDKPFQGDFVIEPGAFKEILVSIQNGRHPSVSQPAA